MGSFKDLDIKMKEEGTVHVFFDMGSTCEWVATFSDERTYDACYDQLEKMAKINGCTLVESVNGGATIQYNKWINKK
tara:strand:- start:1520 stop:1750 length:231 start_codon:yes stop_codon:yes gene_type:complete